MIANPASPRKRLPAASVRRFLLPLVLLGISTTGVAHAVCDGVASPPFPGTIDGNVCGSVYKIRVTGLQAAGASLVKLCPAGSTSGCSVVSTFTYTPAPGFGPPRESFLFHHFRSSGSGYASFDVYAWGNSTSDRWGSSTKPIRRISVDYTGLEGMSVFMPPGPNEPIAVYPNGSNVPDHYTVRWKSGLDADRVIYPVQYEVWFKYWPSGGTEPSAWSLSTATLPCHTNGTGPDSNNECSTHVDGPQPAGNWKWYVVAKLDVSSVSGLTNTVFSQQGGWMPFIQP